MRHSFYASYIYCRLSIFNTRGVYRKFESEAIIKMRTLEQTSVDCMLRRIWIQKFQMNWEGYGFSAHLSQMLIKKTEDEETNARTN